MQVQPRQTNSPHPARPLANISKNVCNHGETNGPGGNYCNSCLKKTGIYILEDLVPVDAMPYFDQLTSGLSQLRLMLVMLS